MPDYNKFSGVVNWARPGRLLAADGVTLKQIDHFSYSYSHIPLNGDRCQLAFICVGNETQLTLGTLKNPNTGIFDLYVNDVLDSLGYDEYAVTSTNTSRYITLTQPIRSGQNTIELRVNEKNVASSDYYVIVYGASLQ